MSVDPAPRIIVFSGSGLSADSGIATFRDADGLWENHDINEVANGNTWRKNWDLVRKFYNARRLALSSAEPNAAHKMIAEWQGKYSTIVLTQNVDDLLERAGCSNVIHLHGELTRMKCVACGEGWNIPYVEVTATDSCPNCQSIKLTRPDVVFFHEAAPNYLQMHKVFASLRPIDCVVVVGTSGSVIDIDSMLMKNDCLKILSNLDQSIYINEGIYDHVFFGKVAENCSKINDVVEDHMNLGLT